MNDAACPADEALMPLLAGGQVDPAVQSHIADCPACRRRLDLFGSDLAGLRATPLPPAPLAPPVWPTVIGKYRVVGPLSADVYRVVDPTRLTELAVRLQPRAMPDGGPPATDGKRLTAVDHPNLARVCDVGTHQNRPFVATEYVRGPTLRELAEASDISPRLAAELTARIALGLDEAHRQGLLHRNITPDTIRIDPAGRPRLLDLGRVKPVPAIPGAATGPTYRAPEQSAGGGQYAGPRTDVYGLGGILHFLLTGHPPFAPEADAETGNVPKHLRLVCAKALATRPDDRYPTAALMADDLIENRSATVTRRRKTRRRALTIAAAMAFVAVIAAMLLYQPTPTAAPESFEYLVTRDGQSATLSTAVPLVPETDRIQVMARIPVGHTGAIFRVDAAGKVHTLPTSSNLVDGETHVVFPPDGQPFAFPAGPSGTELVLACATGNPDSLSDVPEKLGEILPNLPALPTGVVVSIGPDGIQHKPTDSEQPEVVADVETRLGQLRDELSNRNLSVVHGVAYWRSGTEPVISPTEPVTRPEVPPTRPRVPPSRPSEPDPELSADSQ